MGQVTPGTMKRRRLLRPLPIAMGPMTLSITCVVLIGLMAVLYLSQVGHAVDINQQIQQLHQQEATLHRQNQDLAEQLAQEQSPGYIVEHALQQGLKPADPANVHTIFVHGLQPIPGQQQP